MRNSAFSKSSDAASRKAVNRKQLTLTATAAMELENPEHPKKPTDGDHESFNEQGEFEKAIVTMQTLKVKLEILQREVRFFIVCSLLTLTEIFFAKSNFFRLSESTLRMKNLIKIGQKFRRRELLVPAVPDKLRKFKISKNRENTDFLQ